ncbi:YqaJ viral recombinase family protein [Lysinibacter sp. HNR]|uniref:YqaJ viral recombinase family protein n=1 Tax=Lysinibacter sp. HNR TaxID=3031408 RepID=UPI00243492AE|nr:YqaJ viral recombinase family protein [Lysinibacter sp. HNR]WGD38498.1 YqaJ viral recombinase family protein [Lysinibacter sp. HNR]
MTAVCEAQALVDLKVRVLGNDSDRAAWLEARRGVITATEAKVLHTGSSAEKARIVREKVTGEQSFTGNQYTEWGTYREPFIAAQLEAFGLTLCGDLIHAEKNSRHAATPDMIGIDFDEAVFIGEIKTSKNDVSPGATAFDRAGYLWQMLWQMYCTGARRVLYAWEVHDNNFSRWHLRPMDNPSAWGEYGPEVLYLQFEWIDLTPQLEVELEKMIAAADRTLGRLDKKLAEVGMQEAPVFSSEQQVELVRLGTVRADALAAESAAKREKETAHQAAEALFSHVTEDFSEVMEGIKFTWSPSVPTDVTEVDEVALREDEPELWARMEQAQAAVDAANAALSAVHDQWAEKAKEYTTVSPGAPTKARLTITRQKGKSNG